VALPKALESRGGYQVLPPRLFPQQCGVELQLLQCFTWNLAPSDLGKPFNHAATRRDAATKSADSDAGVTPGTRDAWSRVSGFAVVNRSTISFERPGTSE